MNKNLAKPLLFFMIILLAAGTGLILGSTEIGQNAGYQAISTNGGTMDTQQYNRIIDSTAVNFRTIGIILSSLGGMGILVCLNAMLKSPSASVEAVRNINEDDDK